MMITDNLSQQITNISKAHGFDIAVKELLYWKSRCRAAEMLLDSIQGGEYLNYDTNLKQEWEWLKNQEFKRLP